MIPTLLDKFTGPLVYVHTLVTCDTQHTRSVHTYATLKSPANMHGTTTDIQTY